MGWIATLGAAAFALAGVLVGQSVAWRTARQQDRWRPREESMRMLRWGVELAFGGSDDHVRAGVVVLRGLLHSALVDRKDTAFVASVLRYVADRLDDES